MIGLSFITNAIKLRKFTNLHTQYQYPVTVPDLSKPTQIPSQLRRMSMRVCVTKDFLN